MHRGTPERSCCASSPVIRTFELVVATGDSMAGRRAADVYPSLEVAYPDLRVRGVRPGDGRRARPRVPRAAARGVDGARAAARRVGRVRRRPVGGLPAEGRLAVPDVLRLRTHATRHCSPRRCSACPNCTATSSKEARLDRHARLPRHRGDPGAAAARRRRARSRPTGIVVDTRHRHHRARDAPRPTRTCSPTSTPTCSPTG